MSRKILWWDNQTLAYLAGWLEGEGSFNSYDRRKTGRGVSFTVRGVSTDWDTINNISKIVSCGTWCQCRGDKKAVFAWSICGPKAVALAVSVYPLMQSRRKSQIVKGVNAWMNRPLKRNKRNISPSVYICGKMRGEPSLGFPEFDITRDRLIELGYSPISPADEDRKTSGKSSLEDCLKRDIEIIAGQDAIAVMPNWKDSKGGCFSEIRIGAMLDKKIILLDKDFSNFRNQTVTSHREYQRKYYHANYSCDAKLA
jgi:hypothetical protein